MWQLQQPGPGIFERLESPAPTDREVGEGEVLLRFRAGAICGSDIPKFLGQHDPDNPYTGMPGVPLHEFVGGVEYSRDPRFAAGDRAVGIISRSRGLAEYVINPAEYLVPVHDDIDDVTATVVQPVATVLCAYSHVRPLRGRTVAVLGLGPMGLLFTHAAKQAGAAHVIGIDRVDRSDVAETFGIDEFVRSEVRSWVDEVDDRTDSRRPDLVVEAIGHRQEHVGDAVRVARRGGEILVFGLPEDHYVFPMRKFFRKGLTMWAGATSDWQASLSRAQEYVSAHRSLAEAYVTHVYPVDEAATAYREYSVAAAGRLKVALTPPSPGPVSECGGPRRPRAGSA